MKATTTIGGDLTVNRMGFGGMRLCGPGVMGWPADRDNALAVLRRAVDLGVNLLDTSDAYGPHVNEEQFAAALAPYREGVVVATKGGLVRPGGRWERNGHPAHLREACEGSLKRLRIDRIDVYQLHAVDQNVPFEDMIGTLAALQNEGKIRHVGLSNVTVEQLERALEIVPIVSVQNAYNVGDRSSEAVLVACEKRAIAFLPYFPIDAGDLAKAEGPLKAIATKHHVTQAQVALSWLLHRSDVIVPIPGTSSLAHLEENVAAARVALDGDDYAKLDAIAA